MTSTQPEMPEGFDPVTLEVIRMRLDSIVEEMGIAMIRSSGSPVITGPATSTPPCSTPPAASTPTPTTSSSTSDPAASPCRTW